jgi:hypothetical protein
MSTLDIMGRPTPWRRRGHGSARVSPLTARGFAGVVFQVACHAGRIPWLISQSNAHAHPFASAFLESSGRTHQTTRAVI